MAKRIQIGDKVIGSSGWGPWGCRQVIGRYCGKTEDGYHRIKEDPDWVPLLTVNVRRFDDPFNRITWELE